LTNYINAKQNRAYIFEGSVTMPKEKVLVVDDDSAIRYTLTEALRAWGYDPLEASTVAAALESFDAERPSAVLQDVNLPDGSGLDALLEYKKRQPQAIVIMITGNIQLVIFPNKIRPRGPREVFLRGTDIALKSCRRAMRDSATRKHMEKAMKILLAVDGSEAGLAAVEEAARTP